MVAALGALTMSFRKTAILATLVALLGAYVYWVEQPAVEREAQTTRLLDFEPEEITRLELTTPGETIEAERTADGWRIAAPVEGPGDGRAIDTLVRTAAQAEEKRQIDDGDGELSRFGLDAPDAVLRLFAGDAAQPTLTIGKGTPIGFNAYARRGEGRAIFLTGGTVRAALMKRLADLRDKTVLSFSETDVATLTITPRDGPAVSLERATEGWRLTAPIESRAASSVVENLFGSLRSLRAVEFVPQTGAEAEASRGLTPPAFELVLAGAGEPLILRLGDEIDLGDKQLVAATVAGDPQIYLVPTHVPGSLGKDASALRDKTILALDGDSLREVRVRHGDGETYSIVKQDDEWTMADDQETDALLVKRFVDDLMALEGDVILHEEHDLTLTGLDEPDLVIEVFDGDGGSLGSVVARRAGAKDAPIHVAAARESGPVYRVRDYVFTRIAKRPGDFRSSDAVPAD